LLKTNLETALQESGIALVVGGASLKFSQELI
jgi:hypothetical protein